MVRKDNIEYIRNKHKYHSGNYHDQADRAEFNYALKLDSAELLDHTYEAIFKDTKGKTVRNKTTIQLSRKFLLNSKMYCDRRSTCDKCPLDNICYRGFDEYCAIGLYEI